MKKLALILALCAAGCGGRLSWPQVAQKSVEIDYAWTAPASGCASGCTYVLSVLTVASGTAACPASTGSNYVPVNQAAPVSAASYVYQSPTLGISYCAIVQAYNGVYSLPSAPSNVVAVPTQPGLPGAPAGNEKTASMVKPAMPWLPGGDNVAENRAPTITTAQVHWR